MINSLRTVRPGTSTIAEGSKAALLFEKLREQIFVGELMPGLDLTEFALVRRHKVSQSTVRQVLFALESHGLVSRTSSRSMVVTNLSHRDIVERIETRVPLETLAWQKAVPHLAPADFVELRRLSRDLRGPAQFELDYEFHSLLWTRASNETLFRTLDHLATPMFAIVSLGGGFLQSRRSRGQSHEHIVSILERGDLDKIPSAVEKHITSAYVDFPAKYRDVRELAQAVRRIRSPVELKRRKR
jgi:DNA-binding GntR family transcriptional regulator